jgi:hypothetical protein
MTHVVDCTAATSNQVDARWDALLTQLRSVSPHCSMPTPAGAHLASGMVPTIQWIKISQSGINDPCGPTQGRTVQQPQLLHVDAG